MGVPTGQRFLCECGATVQYTRGCECDTRGVFRCTCGATATEIGDEGDS